MATHSSVLAWRTQGRRSLMGCRLWGRTESDMTVVAAAATTLEIGEGNGTPLQYSWLEYPVDGRAW